MFDEKILVGDSAGCEVDMEATGHGAAGELTGPCVESRQEQ